MNTAAQALGRLSKGHRKTLTFRERKRRSQDGALWIRWALAVRQCPECRKTKGRCSMHTPAAGRAFIAALRKGGA